MPAANFPSIEPANVTVVPITPVQINRTLSGRETRDSVSGQYFELVYEFANLDAAERRQVAGHIANANGALQSFYVKLPTGLDDVSGAAAGTITLANSPAAGATTANYTAPSAQNATVFKAGDMIQFDNHSKLYEVTADSITSGSAGTVTFHPPLRTALTTSVDEITYSNINVLARYKTDMSYEVRNNSFSIFTLDFVEVFE